MLEDGNPGIKPVAIVVERIDRRHQSLGFVLAFPRGELKLLRLFDEVGGCGLFAPDAYRGLVDDERDNDRADRGRGPAPEPPERAAIKLILVGKQAGKRAAGVFNVEAAAQLV